MSLHPLSSFIEEVIESWVTETPRLARAATAKYLMAMILYMKFEEHEVTQKYHLFEVSLGLIDLDETMPNSVLRCGSLPE